jgi:hypothetical protein
MSNAMRFVSTGAASTFYVFSGRERVGIVSKRDGQWFGRRMTAEGRMGGTVTGATRKAVAEAMTTHVHQFTAYQGEGSTGAPVIVAECVTCGDMHVFDEIG